MPLVLYPAVMDASKQISSLSLGKWVTFRKISQQDQLLQSIFFFKEKEQKY